MNGQSYTAAEMGHLKIINHLFDCYTYASQFERTQNWIFVGLSEN
jgi:hypothetical protein